MIFPKKYERALINFCFQYYHNYLCIGIRQGIGIVFIIIPMNSMHRCVLHRFKICQYAGAHSVGISHLQWRSEGPVTARGSSC